MFELIGTNHHIPVHTWKYPVLSQLSQILEKDSGPQLTVHAAKETVNRINHLADLISKNFGRLDSFPPWRKPRILFHEPIVAIKKNVSGMRVPNDVTWSNPKLQSWTAPRVRDIDHRLSERVKLTRLIWIEAELDSLYIWPMMAVKGKIELNSDGSRSYPDGRDPRAPKKRERLFGQISWFCVFLIWWV